MVGFALFMTFFIMQPVYQRIDADATGLLRRPLGTEALDNAKGHAKISCLERPKDVGFWVWQDGATSGGSAMSVVVRALF